MRGFSPLQKRIFIGCFLLYASAYVARLNLAAALPDLVATFSLTEAQAGFIQTVFALVYAAGQLVNGALVDRVSPRRHITLGLLGSAACNLLFGLSGAYWQLVLLWALNGAAQSMLWTPVVRLLAGWFTDRQRPIVSFWISITLNVGHLVAWAISGYMAQLFSWRMSFVIPAAVMLGAAVLAAILLRDPEAPLVTAARGDRSQPAVMPVKTMLFSTGLWLVLACCIANGFVRDGVMTWAPTILTDLAAGGVGISATALSLMIPVINLLGVLLGQYMFRRSAGNARAIIAAMMAAGGVSALLLVFFQGGGMFSTALLLGLCCSLMYGVNPLETVILPMEYAAAGRVGLAAGMIDSFIYLGSALVSVSAGALKDAYGLGTVYASWVLVALIGAAAVALSMRSAKRVRGAEAQ